MKKVIASSVLATSVLLPINLLVSDSPTAYATSNTSVVLDEIQQIAGTTAKITATDVQCANWCQELHYIALLKVHTGQASFSTWLHDKYVKEKYGIKLNIMVQKAGYNFMKLGF